MKLHFTFIFLAWASASKLVSSSQEQPPQRSFLRSLQKAPSEECARKLVDLCDATDTPDACGNCAQTHVDALLDAGCTEPGVLAFCRARASNNDNNDQCTDTLETICGDLNTTPSCKKCMAANTEATSAAGCTENQLKKFCLDAEDCPEGEECYTDYKLPIPPTVLPPGTEERPLQVFIQSGQSNCVGQSSSEMFYNDENPAYDDLKGTQEGVWYAGFQGVHLAAPERFFIGPMKAGEASKKGTMLFGPEVSIGNRIYEAMEGDSDVLIIKYCWGGSNIYEEWNPRTDANSWDRTNPDQSSSWLLEESGAISLSRKFHLYANLIYTVRRTLEALDEGNVVYELAGLFWLQGSADKDKSDWKKYGDDSVALFEHIRTDLEAPTLPIVDDGIVYHHINTGKNYAASIIEGCNYIVTEGGFAATNPEDDCVPGAARVCPNSTFINYDVFDFYGYDPNVPDDFKPEGATDKIFHWFAEYPVNQHGEYEGDILTGRNLGNAYIRSFTTYPLLNEWRAEDTNERFPRPPCDPDVNDGIPNADTICWMDQRDELAEEATCDPMNYEEVINYEEVNYEEVTPNMAASGGSRAFNLFSFFFNRW